MKSIIDFGKIFLDQRLIQVGLSRKGLDLPNWVVPIHFHDRLICEKLASFSGRISDEQAPRRHGLQVTQGKSRYHSGGFRMGNRAREANAKLCVRQSLNQVPKGEILGLKHIVNPVSQALGRDPRMIRQVRAAKRKDVGGAS